MIARVYYGSPENKERVKEYADSPAKAGVKSLFSSEGELIVGSLQFETNWDINHMMLRVCAKIKLKERGLDEDTFYLIREVKLSKVEIEPKGSLYFFLLRL